MTVAKSLAILGFAFSLGSTSSAQEQTTPVRIIGISDPSRVEDFRSALKSIPELTLLSINDDKASGVLRYELSSIITKAKPKPEDITPEKILEQINNLVGRASERTFSLTQPTGIAEQNLTKVDIHVGVLDCKGCRYGAYIAVAKLEGVERASVDAATRTLSAWIDSSKTNREALEAALKKARVELP